MVMKTVKKIFGSKSDRDIKRIKPVVEEINEIYETLRDKPDDWFPGRTEEFKAEFKALFEEIDRDLDPDSMDPDIYRKKYRERLDEKFDEILPEAYAMAKEACRRLVGKSWDVSGIEITW